MSYAARCARQTRTAGKLPKVCPNIPSTSDGMIIAHAHTSVINTRNKSRARRRRSFFATQWSAGARDPNPSSRTFHTLIRASRLRSGCNASLQKRRTRRSRACSAISTIACEKLRRWATRRRSSAPYRRCVSCRSMARPEVSPPSLPHVPPIAPVILDFS